MNTFMRFGDIFVKKDRNGNYSWGIGVDSDLYVPIPEYLGKSLERYYNEQKDEEKFSMTADDTSDGIIPLDVRLDFASRMREANTLSKMYDAIYYISKIVDGMQDDYDYTQWGDPEDCK